MEPAASSRTVEVRSSGLVKAVWADSAWTYCMALASSSPTPKGIVVDLDTILQRKLSTDFHPYWEITPVFSSSIILIATFS